MMSFNPKKSLQDNENTMACLPKQFRHKEYSRFSQEALEYAVEYHLKEILRIEEELSSREIEAPIP